MSRPPPSTAYPPLPRGVPHIPPFPQLLHVQGTPPPRRGSMPSDQMEYPSEEDDDDGTGDQSPGLDGRDIKKERGVIKEGTSARKPHATRRRVVQSCSECRRRKIKCDKKFPCGPCILRSDQARCHEVGMAEKAVVSNSSNFASTSDLAALAHRLDALESSLIKSGALLPADLERYLKGTREQMANLQPTPTYGAPNIPDKGAPMGEQETVDDTEGAALTLEHLTFGRSRVEGSHALPHFAMRYPSAVGRSAPNQGYHLAKTASGHSPSNHVGISPGGQVHGGRGPWHDITIQHNPIGHGQSPLGREDRNKHIKQLLDLIGPTDIFDMMYRQTDVMLIALTKVLPSREKGEILVKAYLDRVDWVHRCIHVPTFLASCADLWALPVENVVHEISLPFISLYLAVCTLGIIFMDSAECEKHFSPEDRHNLPDLWYNTARSALWGGDFMANHTLEAIQCIVLMMIYMNNRDRADAAWALLGACVKMAQGLGLSRLGAEQQSVDGKPLPMWTGRWSSVIQREVGRRIWWNLVFLDWVMAPSYNYTTSIQADQIKTALPANIDDEDIIEGQPLQPRPIHVRTSISFQLARLKFAEIAHRQIWQANNNSHPPYSFILSVDGDFRKAMMELPAFFQPDSNSKAPSSDDPKALVQHYEKIMLNLAIHSRMLRLHRPWLSRGYEDERFAYSKEQCIRAARASLRMMGESSNGSAAFLEKYWIPLFYVSVSGLVVIIDLLRTPRRLMNSTETEQKISEVKGALDQMRGIADISHPSRAAVKVMDFLMAEVEERRRPTNLGKRKATGEPGEDGETSDLQRAVKKLIHQAQLEADSPTQSLGANNTPTPGNNAPGWSPAKTGREMDMRIFSDTPRDRPVFDAYPMPPTQPQVEKAGTMPNEGLQVPIQQPRGSSPFTFPVDPTNATFTQFDPRSFGPSTQQPQLDPAVESILTSYFPQPQTTSNTTANGMVQQAPDDFLSKVFNFGWDTSGAGSGGQMQPQGMPQNQVQQHDGMGMGVDAMGMGNGLFDGWSAHSWMA